jgi:hypothetical protein
VETKSLTIRVTPAEHERIKRWLDGRAFARRGLEVIMTEIERQERREARKK